MCRKLSSEAVHQLSPNAWNAVAYLYNHIRQGVVIQDRVFLILKLSLSLSGTIGCFSIKLHT